MAVSLIAMLEFQSPDEDSFAPKTKISITRKGERVWFQSPDEDSFAPKADMLREEFPEVDGFSPLTRIRSPQRPSLQSRLV